MKPQPIETAPAEEGAEILAWYPLCKDYPCKGQWPGWKSGWFKAMFHGEWTTGVEEIDEWKTYYDKPTHWLPVPPAPERSEGERDKPAPQRRPGNAQSI